MACTIGPKLSINGRTVMQSSHEFTERRKCPPRRKFPFATAMAVNDKRTLYVGGLEESVTKETIAAAFRPFGELTDVNLPMDAASSKHKGFAFVQFDDKADAAEAMDNMHNAELFGRVLRVNLAKPDAIKGGHRPVWESQADEFFNKEGAIGGEAPEGDRER